MIQLCRFKQINTFVIGNRQVLGDLTRFLPGKKYHPVQDQIRLMVDAGSLSFAHIWRTSD